MTRTSVLAVVGGLLLALTPAATGVAAPAAKVLPLAATTIITGTHPGLQVLDVRIPATFRTFVANTGRVTTSDTQVTGNGRIPGILFAIFKRGNFG
jgi:hypothetical protein